jgi:hypothetical protein
LFSVGVSSNNQKGIYSQNEAKLIIKIPTKIEFFKNIEIENIFAGFLCTFIKTKSIKIIILFLKNIKSNKKNLNR